MQATHMEAERKYDSLRRAALRAISSQIDSTTGLEFNLIDHKALTAAEHWSASPDRRVDWEWNNYYSFRNAHPKRFELALWQGATLASLSLGRPTYNATGLRLDFIEKNPEPAELKVFQITLAAMSVYADLLGARELRVMHPVNNEVREYYETFGLVYVPHGDYLFTRI